MSVTVEQIENIFAGTEEGGTYEVVDGQVQGTALIDDEPIIAVVWMNCFAPTRRSKPDIAGNYRTTEVRRMPPGRNVCKKCPAFDVCSLKVS